MKNITDFILEQKYNGAPVIASFPINKIKDAIDKEYGCDLDVDVKEDIIIFIDVDNYIDFSIERVQQIIVCKEGIKYTLQKAIPGLGDDCFEVIG